MSAWPWPPIRVGETEWLIMRNSPTHPKAVVRLLPATAEAAERYRAVTWAPRSEQRLLIGYFATLGAADEAVLEDSPRAIAIAPDRR